MAKRTAEELREYNTARMRAWRAKNPEKVREFNDKQKSEDPNRSLKYYYRNRERVLAYNKKPDVVERRNAARKKRWDSDPDYRARLYAQKTASKWDLVDVSLEDLASLRSEPCFYCGGDGGSIDHLVPRSKGGLDRLDNLVPCCKSCNSKKNNKDLADFYATN